MGFNLYNEGKVIIKWFVVICYFVWLVFKFNCLDIKRYVVSFKFCYIGRYVVLEDLEFLRCVRRWGDVVDW